MVVVFNRSHYEAVLGRAGERSWCRRRSGRRGTTTSRPSSGCWRRNGTVVRKFYLHISEAEQEDAVLEREADVTKAWKLTPATGVERRTWGRYIAPTRRLWRGGSTKAAPWSWLRPNRKWFRNLAMARSGRDPAPPAEGWLAALRERGERELTLVRAERERVQARDRFGSAPFNPRRRSLVTPRPLA
jgi:hypothetical protein